MRLAGTGRTLAGTTRRTASAAGTHIAEDLTGFQSEFIAQYPGVEFQLCPPLGLHPLLVEAMLERMEEVWE